MRFVTVIIAALLCTFFVGCGTPKKPDAFKVDQSLVTAPVVSAQTDSATAQAHVQSAESLVQQLLGIARAAKDKASEYLLQATSASHKKALAAQEKVDDSLLQALNDRTKFEQQALAAMKERDDTIEKWTATYDKLDHKWYVKTGRFLEKLFYWIVGIWVGLGILSIIFGLSNPLSWVGKLSAEIVHLIPFANVFVWIENGVRRFFPKKARTP